MVKDSLVFKIFIRFLKEKNMFHIFKKTIRNNYFMDLENIVKIHNCRLTTLSLFSRNLDNSNNNLFYNFLYKNKNIEEFNQIVSFYTKKFIYKFLEDEKIKRRFITNLYELNYTYYDSIKNFKVNKHGDKLISAHIDSLLKDDNSLLIHNFFFFAFDWGKTPQGYEYWANINLKYKKFMSQIFLNEK